MNQYVDPDKLNTSEVVYSGIQFIIALVMIVIGAKYKVPSEIDAKLCTLDEDKPAQWLFIAGICLAVTYSLKLVSRLYDIWAKSDGNVSCGESCMMCVLWILRGCVYVVDFGVICWGIFSAVYPAYAQLHGAGGDPWTNCYEAPATAALAIL